MGLFGFIGNVVSTTVKIVATPIAVVKDVVNITMGNEATSTRYLIESAGDDLSKACDEITPNF